MILTVGMKLGYMVLNLIISLLYIRWRHFSKYSFTYHWQIFIYIKAQHMTNIVWRKEGKYFLNVTVIADSHQNYLSEKS